MQSLRSLVAAGLVAGLAATFASVSAEAQETDLVFYGLQMEELEYRRGDSDENLFSWDGDAFVGTDELKLRLLSEASYDLDEGAFEELENRLVVQTPISDFFDVKAGVRLDTPEGPDRVYGVVGLTGLAPQWFEIDADLFVSEKGDPSARLDAEYELLITNRLILTPSAEIDVAFADDREVGVGAGLSQIEVGLRLSYDLVDRLLSPYVGLSYERKFGETADFARDEGEDRAVLFGVVGVKVLF